MSSLPAARGPLPGHPLPAARLDAPDLLRGVIMVIMLLDHTRDFSHWSTLKFDATDLSQTTPALYFSRWITHFCAPLFVFLAGMSAAFQQHRGKTTADLSSFLFKRGLWLCVLELLLFRSLIFWRVDPSFFFLQVIWVLGVSMICLAVFVRLPRPLVFAISALMVLGHNVFDGVLVPAWTGPDSPIPSAGQKIWMFFHQAGAFPIAGWPSPVVMTQYPLIPWIGVIALGWLMGDVYRQPPEQRARFLIRLGVALTIAFVALRAANVYGDPSDWTIGKNPTFTVLSYLNLTKYPPSLLFLLMTIGPGLVALGLLERSPPANRGPIAQAFIMFGRVPLFFYVLQWVYAHGAGYLLAAVTGRETAPYFQWPYDWQWSERVGFTLGTSYAVWAVGVVLLYFPCRWFAGVKARRKDWWLSYL